VRRYICLILIVITQVSFAFESANLFSKEEFISYLAELKEVKNTSPKSAIEKFEAIDFSRLTDDQKLSVIDVIFPAYINHSKLAKAAKLNESLEKIASKNNIKEQQVQYFMNDFTIRFTQGKVDLALKSITSAKDLAMMHKIDKLEAEILMYLGNYYRRADNYLEAVNQYKQALLAAKTDDLRARILSQLGSANSRLGRLDAAINYLHEALEIHVRNNNLLEISNVYYSIAKANFNMQNFDSALKNYLESNRIDKELGNENNQAYSATSICSLYGWFKEYEKAQEKCDEARVIFTKQNSKGSMVWLNNSIGQSYYQQEKFIELEALMSDSLEQYSDVTSKHMLLNTRSLLVKALIGLKKYKEAEPIALDILRISEENSFASLSENILVILSKIYLGLEEYGKSTKYAHDYIKVSRESRKKTEDKRVASHKNSIEFMTKERDVERLSHQASLAEKALDLKNEQLKLWGSLTLIFIILVLGFSYIILQKRKISLKEKDLLDEIIQKKNQLLADVSHELRTPLTVLKMQIQSLEYNIENDKEVAYQALHRRISEINRLIADIYELSRADAGDLELEIETIQPLHLLTDWCNDTQIVFNDIEGLNFTSNINLPAECAVQIDQDRFIQVLTNLVSNSRRYTSKPGSVSFRAQAMKGMLVLTMEDTSPGVDTNDYSRIFERLYRVDQSRSREHGGSGLGLAICKSLIEAQNGDISAKASSLGGLDIEIRFPLSR